MRPTTLGLGGLAVCLLLVLAVLLGSRGPGPLDQPDRANQRNGLLLDGPTVEPSPPGLGLSDGPTVLLFVRSSPDPDVLAGWRGMLPTDTHVVLVVQEPDPSSTGDGEAGSSALAAAAGADLVVDPDGRLADAVDLPQPVDGGPGVGYAVIDTEGVVRYSTLDPAWPENAFEVATIAGATT